MFYSSSILVRFHLPFLWLFFGYLALNKAFVFKSILVLSLFRLFSSDFSSSNDSDIISDLLISFGLILWHINYCRLFNAKSIFILLKSPISNNSVKLKVKTVLFQTMEFCIGTQVSSIRPIDRSLSGATTPGQSEPGNDGNKGVVCIPQSSSIIGASQSYCLVSPNPPSWSLAIGLFSVISRTLIGRFLLLCREAVGVFYSPGRLGNWLNRKSMRLNSSCLYLLQFPPKRTFKTVYIV